MNAAARELADLPFADALEPFTDEVERGDDVDLALFDGVEIGGVDLGNVRFTECAFVNVEFGSGTCRKARFNDVWMQATRFVGSGFADSVWLDATITSGALSGVQAYGSDWRRVVFRGCKLDSVNFRSSTMIDVTFEDCTLVDVDFGSVTFNRVRFPGTTLRRARFPQASMTEVDFRGAAELEITDGIGSLDGATIDSGQLIDLAPALAAHVGLTVD